MTETSRPEAAILIALMAASVGLFWMRLRRVVSVIRRARPTSDFSLFPLGPRVRQFLREVVAQGKVIGGRPLPGLAHAFVFWGFCAFAPITINHIARGFGVRFLDPAGGFGRFYFDFVAVWAVVVAVSIAGLFVRRFAVRPKWLGAVSPESGVIAALIFLLMVTYLLGLRLAGASAAGRANWWLHTLTLLAFLPLIPHTKHLHLALSPITVFLRRAGFSRIPPLAGDEDFGLDTGKDVTRIDALQAYTCVECGRCTEHCPAYATGKVLNPKEIVLGLREYLNQLGPAGEAPLLGEHISEEAAFQCTTCGACEFECPVGIQHLPLIVGLRRGAVNTGRWENEHGARMFLNLERNGNALGFPAAERQKFIERSGLPYFDGSQEYCLWLGCMGAYDPHGREIVADFARIMDHLGATFGVLRKEKCTGDPARRLGNDLVFQTLAEHGLEQFHSARVQKIVAICPHCVRTIATDWRDFGIAPHIEHHSEFMARHKSRLPVPSGPVILSEARSAESKDLRSGPTTDSVVYHDPCYLGRYQSIYAEPRAVIEQQATLVEAPRNHERSFCCGAGGGLAFLGEEKGDARVSHVRARELAATGAGTVATACPFCNTMFRDALTAITPADETPPQLLDIAQLAARNLPLK